MYSRVVTKLHGLPLYCQYHYGGEFEEGGLICLSPDEEFIFYFVDHRLDDTMVVVMELSDGGNGDCMNVFCCRKSTIMNVRKMLMVLGGATCLLENATNGGIVAREQ
jgi:hypothetical protein